MFLKIQLLIKLQMQVSIAADVRVISVLSNQHRVQILNVWNELMNAFVSRLALLLSSSKCQMIEHQENIAQNQYTLIQFFPLFKQVFITDLLQQFNSDLF